MNKLKLNHAVLLFVVFFSLTLLISVFPSFVSRETPRIETREQSNKGVDREKKPILSNSVINITTPANVTYLYPTTGYYPSTYGFENDTIGYSPSGWKNLDKSGCSSTVASSQTDSMGIIHKNIIRQYDNNIQNKSSLAKNVTLSTAGSIECYTLFSDVSKKYEINFYCNFTGINKTLFRIAVNASKWCYGVNYTAISGIDAPLNNIWYHMSIDYECGISGYRGLQQYKFSVRIMKNWNNISQNSGALNFTNNCNNLTTIVINTAGLQTNYNGYYDAFGFTSEGYARGTNLKEGLLLSYQNSTNLKWIGYSLDFQTNKTINGNTTISWPSINLHTIQIFGNDSIGTMYKSTLRYFTVIAFKTTKPENKTYSEPVSGYYPGTYGFENELVGNTGMQIDFINSIDTKANCEAKIAASSNGHNNVLYFKDGNNTQSYKAYHEFASRSSGTIEFWWLITTTYEPTNQIDIYFISSTSTNAFFVYAKDDYFYNPIKGNLLTFYPDTWYHNKIEFNCAAGTNGQFSWYINGNKIIQDQEFLSNINLLKGFYIEGQSASRGECYFDSFGYSWDSSYTLGTNLDEGLLINYESNPSLGWVGYSLDDQKNITLSGNTTFSVPKNGYHNMKISGNDSLGAIYQTSPLNFSVNITTTFNSPQNISYSDPMDGYYYATYGFENDFGYNLKDWIDLSGSGCSVQVISENQGHKKVMELRDNSVQQAITELNLESSQTSGTFEYWVKVSDSNEVTSLWFYQKNSLLNGIRFYISNQHFYWFDGSTDSQLRLCDSNAWYHIKIQFDVSSDWHLWINGTQEDIGGFAFMGSPASLGTFHFMTSANPVSYSCYIDAMGFSWDPEYTIGDNLDEGLLINFNSKFKFNWMGYSLDGQVNKTIPGNFTIKYPADGLHTIKVFGNNSRGNNYFTSLLYFTIVDLYPPVIKGPASYIVLEQFSSYTLQWNITEKNNGNYVIKRNETVVQSNIFYNWINITISANTTTLGLWNYTIIATDPSLQKGIHTVIVRVVDTVDPVIKGLGTTFTFEQFSSYIFQWNITEINNGNYIIKRNITEIGSGPFFHHLNVSISVNTTVLGFWNYTIIATDPSNNIGSYTIIVHIVDITKPKFIELNYISLVLQGNRSSFSWKIIEFNPTNFMVYQNNTLVNTTISYVNNTIYSFSFLNVTLCQIQFRIVAYDNSGNSNFTEFIVRIIPRNDGLIFLQPSSTQIFNLTSSVGLYIEIKTNSSSFGFLKALRQTSIFAGLNSISSDLKSHYYYLISVLDNDFEVNNSVFEKIMIRYYYSTVTVLNAVNLKLQHYLDQTDEWVVLTQNLTLNTNLKYMEYNTTKLSYFNLAEAAVPEEPVPGDDDGEKETEKKTTQDLTLIIIIIAIAAMVIVGSLIVVKSKSKKKKVETQRKKDEEKLKAIATQKKAGELQAPEKEVVKKQEICYMHKEIIEGAIYTCPQCQAKYCMNCTNALFEKNKPCYACGAPIEPISEISLEKIESLDVKSLTSEAYFETIILNSPNILKIWLLNAQDYSEIYSEVMDQKYISITQYDNILVEILKQKFAKEAFAEKAFNVGRKSVYFLIYTMKKQVKLILVSKKRLSILYQTLFKQFFDKIEENLDEIVNSTETVKKLLNNYCFIHFAKQYSEIPAEIEPILKTIFQDPIDLKIIKKEILKIPIEAFSEFLELYGRLSEEYNQISDKENKDKNYDFE